jgi:hypothetical protein
MRPTHRGPKSIIPAPEFPRCLHEALAILMRAANYARDLHRDVWDFAVELTELQSAGLTSSDLRWLVCKGYAEHAVEITPAGQQHRRFRQGNRLSFDERTCVVLTDAGLAVRATRGRRIRRQVVATGLAESPYADMPFWEGVRRELRVGATLVKCFKQPAPYQEAILAAFEEEGWPLRIDDPLPPKPDRDPKRHLHDTINNLNRNQRERLIHFFGDGHAEGVCWELLV